MSDIFLSHKSSDGERLRPLVEVLEDQGWDVWWSQDDIRTGVDWAEKIDAALDEARCVVVAWSEDSVSGDTDWVFSEAEAARKQQKLVPLMLDPVELPKPFDRVQTADLSDWIPAAGGHQGLERLVSGIAAMLDAKVDYRRLPRPGLPVAHAIVAAAGLLATAGPMVYVARTGPPPQQLYLLLGLIAVAAGAAAFSLIRGLFPWGILGFRSLRHVKPAVALAASVLFGAAAAFVGFLLGSSGTPIELEFRAAGEAACPAGLVGVEAQVRWVEGAREVSAAIGPDCRAQFRLRTETLAGAEALVTLAPGPEDDYFVVAQPFSRHALDDRQIRVEVVRARETPRARLSMLEYDGDSDRDFEDIPRLLRAMLETLKEQLRDELRDDPHRQRAREQLDVLQIQDDDAGPENDRLRLDHLKRIHALGLLWGEQAGDAEVTSRIFVSDVPGEFDSFRLTTRLNGDGSSKVSNAHRAAFLYALAMDARRLGSPRELVMAYLSRATELASNLDATEIGRLRQRIDDASDEIRRQMAGEGAS